MASLGFSSKEDNDIMSSSYAAMILTSLMDSVPHPMRTIHPLRLDRRCSFFEVPSSEAA